MKLQEKIQKKAEEYGKFASVFLEGAKFALENQWISIKDDLPCNHKKLIHSIYTDTTLYVVANIHGITYLSRMYFLKGKWHWEADEPTYWMPIPKLPKE